MQRADKYATAKAEITAIYHENKGRYGYRRITMVLYNKGIPLNHKIVQRLMQQWGLLCRVRMKKYRRIKAKLKGLPPALHRQQALSIA